MPLIHFSENPKSPSLLLRLEWTDEGDSSVVVGELLHLLGLAVAFFLTFIAQTLVINRIYFFKNNLLGQPVQ